MTDGIGVVLPAYDPEIETLVAYIRSIRETIDPETVRVEIDDPDESHVARLEGIADEVEVSEQRRGKGAAVMAGFDGLDTDILVFTDADGSIPADSLADIVRQVATKDCDVSIGSRRHPSSNIVSHQTVVRRTLGDVFAFAAKKMLPTECRDYQCGAKAVRAEAWEAIGHHCYEPGFAWDLEFVSVAGSLGYRIAEVPIEWEDHPDSKVDPVSTSIELGAALVDVKRRTDALAESPRHNDVQKTDHSRLMHLENEND
jgi:glycosyltransferase involved in cell wall biosynthesis